jgi:hypothetical protein
MATLACAVFVGSALAAPATGGRHFPHFSLLSQHVAVKKLPPELRFMVEGPPGAKGFGSPLRGPGPVWFGQVERPGATFAAVAKGHWICQYELPKDELRGGGGSTCATPAAAREFGLLDVGSCGKGPPRQFRVHALLPDGVSRVEIVKEDGKVGRALPVIENTIAFTIGRENVVVRGGGGVAAEGLERNLPLADASKLGDNRGGCSFYAFAEAKPKG